ncbi:Aste57867_24122 [Aphanomyces stellatus]|uniref:Protein arginine N-methyltransferase n=1 Tax=Aphanomyces stellatus TaxID=120398 RepID=A0A485LTY3_9STRA|nr:hypothetical protein As57867_024048 [Aphanomyces stellatus]VFU00764.1 Aste57867_24122 [Aphanomyces stellatus]
MYAGTDKYGGGVVGEDFKDADAAPPNLEDILDTASAEETVVTSVPYSYLDEETNTVVEGVSSVCLSSRLNPESGGLMWVEEEDSAETYKNVVSMSQMTSMLRDLDRNAAYEHGIRTGIERFIQEHGRRPIVLDIGTGTGLLAMLAARHGAQHVYACEMFQTMAEIANEVTMDNGFADQITVLPLRSTDLIIPDHMPVRADMLVSELFDSLLLGEGILPTLHHARTHLLVDRPIIVPQHATVYAKLVQSDVLFRMNSFDRVHAGSLALARNADTAWQCSGGRVALPLHIENEWVDRVDLTSAAPFLSFDFGLPHPPASQASHAATLTATTAGQIDAIVMWWSVDFGGGVSYNTAPGVQNWQDHWVPVVFPLTTQRQVVVGDQIELTACHDSLRVWFDVPEKAIAVVKKPKRDPFDVVPCTCGLHLICNAERVSMLTNASRTAAFEAALQDGAAAVRAAKAADGTNQVTALDISDGSLCTLLAASVGVDAITSVESKEVSSLIFSQIVSRHALDDRVTVHHCGVKGLLPEHLHGEKSDVLVDLLVGEPFYYAMQNLPIWQALNFWYRRSALDGLLAPHARVLPYRGSIRALGVRFEHLHECFGTVGAVSGFDHAAFDALQGGYLDRDFPFPTYMYPYVAATSPFEVMPIPFMETVAPFSGSFCVPLASADAVNAVILWVEYDLDMNGQHKVTTGPSCVHSKQAVRFLKPVAGGQQTGSFELRGVVNFEASEGVIAYEFAVAEAES